MSIKNTLIIAVLSVSIFSCTNSVDKSIYKNKDYSIMERVENLLSQMTIGEKVAQLNLIAAKTDTNIPEDIEEKVRKGLVGNILKSNGVKANSYLQKLAIEETRLGIPLMFQEDVIHGYRTIFPGPMAEACSWNLEGIRQTAAVAAKEASASGIHLTYAPMVDISRDPRWGRIVEGAGEDPYLASLIAAERVKGFQGDNMNDSSTLAACVKHFIGYGDALAGRDYNIGDFSEREMREIYLPPFKAAIDADVKSLMIAYTTINGVPATANKDILIELLRKELGFDNTTITDWNNITNMVSIGTAADGKDAVTQAMSAEVDMDMFGEKYAEHLEELVTTGIVPEESLDKAVRRVLTLKFELGLFDDPYKYLDLEREKEVQLHASHVALAQQAACESMVLLENKNQILPLSKNIKTIAVIGPLATRKKDLMSWWGAQFSQADTNDITTILDAIKQKVSTNTKVEYAEGIKLDGFGKKGLELIPEAVALAKKADVVILTLGEEYWMSGEGGSISDIDLPGAQNELIAALTDVDVPVITVLVNGRPYDIRKPVEEFDAVLEAWQPGTMGGFAIADVLFGDYNPSGKLVMTWPQNTGQIPIFYNYKRSSHDSHVVDMSNRFINNYLDITTEPLYAFGYGKSYTEFEYGDATIDTSGVNPIVSVTISNKGKVAGVEVVQLYIKDLVCSVAQPHKELQDFARLELQAGESKSVNFEITRDKLMFVGADMQPTFEAGEFEIMVGSSSRDEDLQTMVLEIEK